MGARAPPTGAGKKKPPKSSRPTKSKGGLKSHTALGVAKPIDKRRDKRTPKQRANERLRLEKSLPILNTVVPAEAGKKRKGGNGKVGKVFVDEADVGKMMRLVEQAVGKVQVGTESRLEKARKLEAIREARRLEEEKKIEDRKEKMDDVKDRMRKKRKPIGFRLEDASEPTAEKVMNKKGKGKRVAFA